MVSTSDDIAVLTGDLVASRKLSEAQITQAFDALENCAETQAEWHGEPLHFTRHRGDGWQVVLRRPELALRSALAFRASLRAKGEEFDSYIGVAEGERPNGLGPDLNVETADVFVNSGSALSWTKGTKPDVFEAAGVALSWTGASDEQFRMACHPIGPLYAAFILADRISRDWTQAQAEAIYPFLAPLRQPTYTEVAKRLGKSRQAVSKALDAAKYMALLYACTGIEVDRQYQPGVGLPQ